MRQLVAVSLSPSLSLLPSCSLPLFVNFRDLLHAWNSVRIARSVPGGRTEEALRLAIATPPLPPVCSLGAGGEAGGGVGNIYLQQRSQGFASNDLCLFPLISSRSACSSTHGRGGLCERDCSLQSTCAVCAAFGRMCIFPSSSSPPVFLSHASLFGLLSLGHPCQPHVPGHKEQSADVGAATFHLVIILRMWPHSRATWQGGLAANAVSAIMAYCSSRAPAQFDVCGAAGLFVSGRDHDPSRHRSRACSLSEVFWATGSCVSDT